MAYRTLDVARFQQRVGRVADEWRPGSRITALQQMHGGASGLTFALELEVGSDRQRAVVKVAPAGLKPVGNRDVLRQAAVQRALADSVGIPVPEILFAVAGEGLDDPPFYGMARVDGESYEPLMDLEEQPTSMTTITARAEALVDAMVALHRVPVATVWPEGQAPVDLVGEVGTWKRALDSVGADDVEDAHGELADAAAGRLLAAVPRDASVAPVLVHGDLRLGNALFEGTTLRAVIDWEICRVGHPLLDLAWLCSFVDPVNLATRVRDVPGLVPPAALAERYAAASGTAIDELAWFSALVCFKQAAVTALIVKNNRRRVDPDPHLVSLGPQVATYLERVLALVPSSPASGHLTRK